MSKTIKPIRFFALFFLFSVIFFSACSPVQHAKIEERKVYSVAEQTEEFGGVHVRYVQQGDTLYSIAFAAGLDVSELALWNGIRPQSKIRVGQRIRLTKPLDFSEKKALSNTSYVQLKGQKKKTIVGKKSHKTLKKEGSQHVYPQVKKVPFKTLKWFWPVKQGKVIGLFSLAKNRQGIDIQKFKGSLVLAAANGEVVYVGNGLKGYGNLIIIKHNDTFLSAYAHNQETFVIEGEKVKASQRIGSMGYNDQRQIAMHFQIREKGSPVNPLNYLLN